MPLFSGEKTEQQNKKEKKSASEVRKIHLIRRKTRLFLDPFSK